MGYVTGQANMSKVCNMHIKYVFFMYEFYFNNYIVEECQGKPKRDQDFLSTESRSWWMQKLGNRNFILIYTVGVRRPTAWDIFCCLAGQRALDQDVNMESDTLCQFHKQQLNTLGCKPSPSEAIFQNEK